MTSILQNNSVLSLPGALISGLAIYFIFLYLFIPNRITLPVSIVISLLVFGLTKYYTADKANNETSSLKDTGTRDDDANKKTSGYNPNNNNNKSSHIHLPPTNIFFILGYIIALLVIAIGSFSSLSMSNPDVEPQGTKVVCSLEAGI